MSTYYNPPSKVKENGYRMTRLGDEYPTNKFSNRLVAVMNNGLFDCAVDVTDKKEFEHFYQQYYSGMWLSFELYDYREDE